MHKKFPSRRTLSLVFPHYCSPFERRTKNSFWGPGAIVRWARLHAAQVWGTEFGFQHPQKKPGETVHSCNPRAMRGRDKLLGFVGHRPSFSRFREHGGKRYSRTPNVLWPGTPNKRAHLPPYCNDGRVSGNNYFRLRDGWFQSLFILFVFLYCHFT